MSGGRLSMPEPSIPPRLLMKPRIQNSPLLLDRGSPRPSDGRGVRGEGSEGVFCFRVACLTVSRV